MVYYTSVSVPEEYKISCIYNTALSYSINLKFISMMRNQRNKLQFGVHTEMDNDPIRNVRFYPVSSYLKYD